MNMIGYTLVGTFFEATPKSQDDVARGTLLLKELCALRFSMDPATQSAKVHTFEDATGLLCGILRVKCKTTFKLRVDDASSTSVFWEGMRKLRDDNPAYAVLGVVSSTNDSGIAKSYEMLKAINRNSKAIYMDALLEIIRLRTSSLLEDLAIMEKSKGVVSKKELDLAYSVFGGAVLEDTSSRTVVEIYKRALEADPAQRLEYTEAIKVIANHRDCAIIKYFLEKGGLPPFLMDEMNAQVVLPAGLNNIGNTCYLNCLLQYLFSITALREFALTWVMPELTNAEVASKETIRKRDRAIEFMKLLKELFLCLVMSDEGSVTPSKQLALIVLNTTTGALFGEQQDINETMDNIHDITLDGRPRSGHFHGVTKQTLHYTDKNGVEKINHKEEDFHQFIVDLKPTLYDALDENFGWQSVDFENTIAQKSVSVLNLPLLLTVRVNRVVFDRETCAPVKKDDFMDFPKILHLDRYCFKNEKVKQQKLETKKDLLIKLARADLNLEHLTTKGHRSAAPLKLLGEAINIVNSQRNFSEAATKLCILLPNHALEVNEKVLAAEDEVKNLKSQIDKLFDEFKDNPYHLYGVFVHEGGANFGHYWSYLFDAPRNRWIKYNDSVVAEVSEDEIFMNTSGKPFNAFSLVYMNIENMTDIACPFVRTAAYREKWL